MKAAPAPVLREWQRRVEAEYRSAAVTQHFVHWLLQIGASPDLVRAGLRIVDDELSHAELSLDVLRAAGGRMEQPLSRENLALARRPDRPLEHDVLLHGVEVYCLGETAAVSLFRRLRAAASVSVARKALDRVLQDEARHSAFGWTFLRWMLSQPDAGTYRAWLTPELPGMIAALHGAYSGEGGDIAPEAAAWGLMSPADYGAATREALRRRIGPRLRACGLAAGAVAAGAVAAGAPGAVVAASQAFLPA